MKHHFSIGTAPDYWNEYDRALFEDAIREDLQRLYGDDATAEFEYTDSGENVITIDDTTQYVSHLSNYFDQVQQLRYFCAVENDAFSFS